MVSRANKTVGVGGHIATYASRRVAVRGRLQPLLPRQGPRQRHGRPDLLPGPRRARHLRPRLPRGPADRAAPRRLPAGEVARAVRAVVLPAPAADAGLLGVPDRLDGPRPDQRDLPGPVQPLPARARASPTRPTRTSGPSSATARWTRSSRSARSASPPARSSTTSPSSSTATCSASTARSAATARSSRSWSRTSAAPAGTSSRSSGDATGTRCSPRDGDGVLVNQMNTTPDGQFQTYTVETGAYIREHFFGGDPRLRKMVEDMSDDDLRRLSPRRPRLPQGVRRVRGGARARRPADGDPRQDDQGLDARVVRGPQRHPPDEEADQGRPEGVPRPALPADHRRGARRRPAAVLPPGREVRRDPVHEGAPGRARRRAAQAGRARQAAARCPATTPTPSCRRARASSRSRPRWRPSGCSRT